MGWFADYTEALNFAAGVITAAILGGLMAGVAVVATLLIG